MKKIYLALYIILACLSTTQFIDAMDSVDISGLDKKLLLNALYQKAQPQNMGFMHYK